MGLLLRPADCCEWSGWRWAEGFCNRGGGGAKVVASFLPLFFLLLVVLCLFFGGQCLKVGLVSLVNAVELGGSVAAFLGKVGGELGLERL